MTNRFDKRPTGVKLTLLDLAPVLESAAKSPHATADAYEISFGPYATAEVDGKLYVICNEGVGWEVTDEEPLELDLYVKKPGTISIVPSLRATLSPAEVREHATGEKVDLADHVRRFGARLESNFWAWLDTLSAARSTTNA